MGYRVVASLVLVVAGLATGTGVGVAQSAGGATVQVTSGPTTEATFAAECNDVVVVFDEATSFVLERTGEVGDALTVAYEVDGSAVAGEHYEALPGVVEFGAGEASTTVAVEVLSGERTEMVELQLHVVDGNGYQPGAPSEATIRFVRPRDPSLAPAECGFFFAEGDRIERTVETGSTPERLVVEEILSPIQIEVPPEGYRMVLKGGTLPPGLALAEDGRFMGSAEEAGTYESTVEACRTEPAGTCVTATLVVTVQAPAATSTPPTSTLPTSTPPSSSPSAPTPARTIQTLPATGVSSGSTAGLAVVLIGLGLALWGASALSSPATAPGRVGRPDARPAHRWPSRQATWGRGRRGPGPGGRRAQWRGPRER